VACPTATLTEYGTQFSEVFPSLELDVLKSNVLLIVAVPVDLDRPVISTFKTETSTKESPPGIFLSTNKTLYTTTFLSLS
jgi:hypothetical protein